MNLAEKKYIEIMRKKSGEERLKIAFELRKMALEMAKSEIKDRNPKISPSKLRKKILQRIYGTTLPLKTSSK